MITATSNLEGDHVQILRLIEVMQKIAGTNTPKVEHLEQIVKVIREFADGLHHTKEEHLLFPLMVQKGFSTQTGPVAAMLHDHTEGRNFVKAMTENITRYKQGEMEAMDSIKINMLGYSNLLVNHIAKENNVLFRMADRAFSDAEQETLYAQFVHLEEMNDTRAARQVYVSMINDLAAEYLANT